MVKYLKDVFTAVPRQFHVILAIVLVAVGGYFYGLRLVNDKLSSQDASITVIDGRLREAESKIDLVIEPRIAVIEKDFSRVASLEREVKQLGSQIAKLEATITLFIEMSGKGGRR